MDGTISVISKLGTGSEFTFTMNVHKVFTDDDQAEAWTVNKKSAKRHQEIIISGQSAYNASEDDFYEQDLEELSARMNE